MSLTKEEPWIHRRFARLQLRHAKPLVRPNYERMQQHVLSLNFLHSVHNSNNGLKTLHSHTPKPHTHTHRLQLNRLYRELVGGQRVGPAN